MAAKSPLMLVKERFGDKSKLVEAVETFTGDELWVKRTNENKGLAHVSNAKLLHLHAVFTEVREKFGTREKLIDAILELQKRGKDSGLRQALSAWPLPRLYDTYRSTAKRQRAASGEKKASPKPVTAAGAKGKAVKPAAAKGAKKTAKKESSAKKKSRKG